MRIHCLLSMLPEMGALAAECYSRQDWQQKTELSFYNIITTFHSFLLIHNFQYKFKVTKGKYAEFSSDETSGSGFDEMRYLINRYQFRLNYVSSIGTSQVCSKWSFEQYIPAHGASWPSLFDQACIGKYILSVHNLNFSDCGNGVGVNFDLLVEITHIKIVIVYNGGIVLCGQRFGLYPIRFIKFSDSYFERQENETRGDLVLRLFLKSRLLEENLLRLNGIAYIH